MKFQNPFVPQTTVEAEPRWKGEIRGYYLAVCFWKKTYLKAFVSREEYDKLDLPIKQLR